VPSQLFFALVSADLVTFLVATFVEFVPSQASLAALSSASKADMRALAVVKATTIQKRKDSKKSWEDTRTSRGHKHKNRHTLRGLSSNLKPDALSTKGEFFLHQSLQNKSMSGKIKQRKSKYRKHYSCFPKKLPVKEPQEKYSLPCLLQMLGSTKMSTLLSRDFW
jgi:hypothetical protein